MSGKVTVIVPYYNVEKYIGKCLSSLNKQDYPDYDVILVDDKSPDGSRAIVERYVARYPEKFRLMVNEENMGQGRSRMSAVEATDAEYIMFVDSDDYVAKDYISTFVKAAQGKSDKKALDGCDMVISGFTKDIQGNLKRFSVADSPFTILLYPVACCKLYRRDFLIRNRIDFSDSRKGEDIYFSLATFYSRPRFKVIKYYGYFYRLNPTSTTSSMNYENGFEEIVKDMFDKFRANFDVSKMNDRMKQAVEYTYIANMVNALVVYGHGSKPGRMRKKVELINKDISDNYPNLMQNPYMGLLKPSSVSLKIRLGVGAFYWTRRFGLDKLMFDFISLI
ncbi:MAG: glycosyltransferase [Eubacterium sp.]|nr:glycosyltransferase [Eubacterium sp.]